ncbi:MAG: hypothetical protein AAFW01_20325 [Pseudomonadota bacterium]
MDVETQHRAVVVDVLPKHGNPAVIELMAGTQASAAVAGTYGERIAWPENWIHYRRSGRNNPIFRDLQCASQRTGVL